MSINELVDEFIVSKEKDMKEKSIKNYRAKMSVFSSFINTKKLEANSLKAVLVGFDVDLMKESMDFYKKNRNIHYDATMNLYVSVVKEFFTFLLNEKDIRNLIFADTNKRNLFDEQINEKIKKMNLASAKDKEQLSDDEVTDVIQLCDKILKNVSDQKMEDEEYYKQYLSAIAIKLTLYAGLKMNTLYKLCREAFVVEDNTVKINDYIIGIPYDLSRKINVLKQFQARKIEGCSNEDFLFIDFNKKLIDTSNDLFALLKPVAGTTSSAKVASYSLINMIQKGINTNMLESMTGNKADILAYCQEQVNDCFTEEDRSRYMSSKLQSMEMFSRL